MTETLGYAISKTWYIVLIFVALAIGIAFLSKKKSSKALVALSALCLVFSVGSFAFGGLTVSEAQSKGASFEQLNSMNLIELVQANQAAPAQTSVNDVNELYNKMVYVYVFAFLVIGMALMGMTFGPMAALLPELFPTEVRYSGASLAYNIASIIGATIAAMISLKINALYGLMGVGIYLAINAFLTLLALLASKETKNVDLTQI